MLYNVCVCVCSSQPVYQLAGFSQLLLEAAPTSTSFRRVYPARRCNHADHLDRGRDLRTNTRTHTHTRTLALTNHVRITNVLKKGRDLQKDVVRLSLLACLLHGGRPELLFPHSRARAYTEPSLWQANIRSCSPLTFTQEIANQLAPEAQTYKLEQAAGLQSFCLSFFSFSFLLTELTNHSSTSHVLFVTHLRMPVLGILEYTYMG